jgi:hypothetical protein
MSNQYVLNLGNLGDTFILIVLWYSAWELAEVGVQYISRDSKIAREFILAILFILSTLYIIFVGQAFISSDHGKIS